VRAAYLYWAGSGSTPDTNVTLNGSSVTADRVFTATFPFNGTDYDFFSGFADVTSLVAGNGNITVGGLTVNTGAPHCAVEAVQGGWGLIFVYADPAEDLRAVNIFDGFQFVRGSALTLTLSGFRIPPAPINGRVTHITWEGDPQNSGSLAGFSESLTFNGSLLDDGLVPPGSSPTVQQFDGTVNTLGSTTSYGADIDTYDVSPWLNAGDTSATTTYSSGGDLVLLSAEVISFTTEPIVDLSLAKTHAGDFVAGTNGVYSIVVSNNGPEPDPGPIQVTDTLPGGLTYQSASGSGWVCNAVAQQVTCDHPGPVAVGASLPGLDLTVAVGGGAAPAVDNTASVASASVDGNPANNTAIDPTTVISSDLSTSTKSVIDLNGGDADPGDTLRYTITLTESAGVDALDVRVTDDMPGLISGFSIVDLPPGSLNNSTAAPTGANGTGFLDISNFSVPAGTSASLSFDVTIAPGAVPGDIIANQADITVGNGAGAQPVSANVVVSESRIPGRGTKTLYLFDGATSDPQGFNQGAAPYLSRTPPTAPQASVSVRKGNPPVTWTLTPALRAPLDINGGNIPVTLWLSKGGSGGGAATRQLQVSLATIGTLTGPLGAPVTLTFAAPPAGSPAAVVFNIPLASVTTLPSGTQITLTLQNTTSGGGGRQIRVFPLTGGEHSRIDLDALTVINVAASATFDALLPSGTPTSDFAPGQTVVVRADVSDPFGSFDIAGASLELLDALGNSAFGPAAMSRVQDSGLATATFELSYPLPANAPAGTWTTRVLATEGTEAVVTDLGTGSFTVTPLLPDLVVLKSVVTLSDPQNGSTNPKAIPGAVVLYTLDVTNQGVGGVDPDSLILTDVMPANLALFVESTGPDPVVFLDGTTPSGLGYDFDSNVTFSNQVGGGEPFNYTPVPDATGFDPAVTALRVNPSGTFAGSSGAANPSFQVRFRARVQ
jgi:uncharacterized repeat protein (TIGR01451 family)